MSELIICVSTNITHSPNMILFCRVLIGTNRSSINTCIQPPTMLNNSTNILPAANMDSDGINRMSKYLREKKLTLNEYTNT